MAEIVPILGVGRPVTNVRQEHIASLQTDLVERVEDPSAIAGSVRRMFILAYDLYEPIIDESEIYRLQYLLGSNRLDEQRVEKLGIHVRSALSDCSEARDASTLPTEFQRAGDGPKHVLAIATSQAAMKERVTAQEAVAEFIGSRIIPSEGVWSPNDRKITQVKLAFSNTEEEVKLLTELAGVIDKSVSGGHGEHPFPVRIKLGKIATPRSKKPRDPKHLRLRKPM